MKVSYETAGLAEDVFTLGFPLTSVLGRGVKYTVGAISSNTGLGGDDCHLQHSVPIQPGNSGGPLLSRKSFDVHGLIVSTASVESFYSEFGVIPQSIGWSLKTSCFPEIQGFYDKSATNFATDIQSAQSAVAFIESTSR